MSMVVQGVNPAVSPTCLQFYGFPSAKKQPMQNRCFQRTAWALPLGIRWHLLLLPNLCCSERSFEISSFSLFRNVSESAAYYVITSETKPASGWEVIFLYVPVKTTEEILRLSGAPVSSAKTPVHSRTGVERQLRTYSIVRIGDLSSPKYHPFYCFPSEVR